MSIRRSATEDRMGEISIPGCHREAARRRSSGRPRTATRQQQHSRQAPIQSARAPADAVRGRG